MTLSIAENGVVSDWLGPLRSIPQKTKSGSYTANVTDVGCHISTTAGVTVNANIFSAGDIFHIYNNSASNITITQGTSVTLRLIGTATTGNRTLAQRGFATVYCTASNDFLVMGTGVS